MRRGYYVKSWWCYQRLGRVVSRGRRGVSEFLKGIRTFNCVKQAFSDFIWKYYTTGKYQETVTFRGKRIFWHWKSSKKSQTRSISDQIGFILIVLRTTLSHIVHVKSSLSRGKTSMKTNIVRQRRLSDLYTWCIHNPGSALRATGSVYT